MKPLFSILFPVLTLCFPAAAFAELIDNFGDWSAFIETENADKVCFIAGEPKKSKGEYAKRGDVNLMVTHRPAEKSLHVVSFNAGYAYQGGSEAVVTIGSGEFRLFTDGGVAWAYDAEADKALVNAMRAGSTMTVTGASNRGTLTTDTYSLTGFSAAHTAINSACGVK